MVERTLHARAAGRSAPAVSATEIAAIADADARENWQVMIAFRDHLLRHPTLEAAYLDIVRNGAGNTPPLFLNQLVHVILRNALDGCDDPFVLRAAELFFRTQRMTLHEGSLIAADEETIAGTNDHAGLAARLDARHSGRGRDRRSSTTRMPRAIGSAATSSTWRSISPPAGAGLRRWPRRCGAGSRTCSASRSTIEPLTELRDAKLTWYVGLDADGTRIGDVLWNGEELDEASAWRAWSGCSADLPRSAIVIGQGARRAGLSDPGDDADKLLRMKPQNLVDRPAGPPSGGGHMSASPLATHSGRRRGGAQQERESSGSISSGGRSRCCRRAGAPPWTELSDDGERATFYAGAADIELYRSETAYYRDNLATGRAAALGRAASDRSAIRPTSWSPSRPIRPKARLDRSRQQSGRDRCRCRSRSRRSLRRSSPSTMSSGSSSSASATAPIRKRWRGAGYGGSTMSDEEDFLSRWSRRKRDTADGMRRPRSRQPELRTVPQRRKPGPINPLPHARRGGRPAGAGIRPDESAARSNSIDAPIPTSRRFFARRAGGADPCGASTRLDSRSGDPRLRRARGERLGLHRSRRRCRVSARWIDSDEVRQLDRRDGRRIATGCRSRRKQPASGAGGKSAG